MTTHAAPLPPSPPLPPGWTLYSEIHRGEPCADWDFGARRDDRLAFCWGQRDAKEEKKDILAQLSHVIVEDDHGERQKLFKPHDLAAAVAWCDQRLRALHAAPLSELPFARST